MTFYKSLHSLTRELPEGYRALITSKRGKEVVHFAKGENMFNIGDKVSVKAWKIRKLKTKGRWETPKESFWVACIISGRKLFLDYPVYEVTEDSKAALKYRKQSFMPSKIWVGKERMKFR